MGAGGMNFPPGVPPIGQFETFAATALVAALTTTTFYTAPVSGLYLVGFSSHINTTNKAGTIAVTMTTPHAGTVALAANSGTGTITAIEADPALGGTNPVDGYSALIPVWMNAGDVLQLAAAVSGLTGTNYSLFAVVGRVL
jgi:hypothetical protein